MDSPIPPLWLRIARPPGSGRERPSAPTPKPAATLSVALRKPSELGPVRRTPHRWAHLHQLLLQAWTVAADLAEAGGEHDGERDARRAAVLDHARDPARGDGDDGDVGARRHVAHRRVGRQPGHLGVLGCTG